MAFEVISSDTKINSLRIAKQLYVAYSHRTAALRASTDRDEDYVSEPSQNTRLFTFIAGLQNFVKNEGGSFYKPDFVLNGSESSYVPTMYLDGSVFASVTGLKASGRWRRIPAGSTPPTPAQWSAYDWTGYSYGAIQDGDIAGPWLWQDLIKAFEKLTRIKADDYLTITECYSDSEYTASTTGLHPLTGKIDWSDSGGFDGKVTMYRKKFGDEENPNTQSVFDAYGASTSVPYYKADGVTSVKNCVYDSTGSTELMPSVVPLITSSNVGKLVSIPERSTFDADEKSYFVSYLLDKDALTGLSRESRLVAEGVNWPSGLGQNDKTIQWSYPSFFIDYSFPDGETE